MRNTFWYICNDFSQAGGAESVVAAEVSALNELGISAKAHYFAEGGWGPRIRWIFDVVSQARKADCRRLIIHVHNFATLPGLLAVLLLRIFSGSRMTMFHTAHDYLLVSLTRDGLIYSSGKPVNIYAGHRLKLRYFCSADVIVKTIRHLFFRGFVRVFSPFSVMTAPSLHLTRALTNSFPTTITRLLRNPAPVLHKTIADCKSQAHYLIIGRLTVEKGVLNSLRYYAQHYSDSKLYVIGDGPLLSQMQSLVANHDLINVEFLGWLPRERVSDYMAGAVLLYSSVWTENAPMIFLEAYRYGARVESLVTDACVEEFSNLLPRVFGKSVPIGQLNGEQATGVFLSGSEYAESILKLVRL